MTTTRTVSNTGAPLVGPGGTTVRNGTRVQFTLVDASTLAPCSAFDATTGEEISGTVAATTTSGVFSASLWPNDRGTPATKYLCTINAPNFTPFAGVVRDAVGTLDFVDFFSDGQVLTPAQISTLLTHIGDTTVHLTAAQNTLLDGLDAGLTASELNFVNGVTSSIQTQIDGKASLASPAFTGNPTAPTAAPGDNDTSIATTAFVSTAIANLALAATYQPLDGDLTAIAALTSTGYLMRTGAVTWALVAAIPFADVADTGNLGDIAALADPGADRALFWDDSAGAYAHLTIGSNLAIVGTTLNASGTLVDGIEDAPGDGERYARCDGTWKKIPYPIVSVSDVTVAALDGETALHGAWTFPRAAITGAGGGSVRAWLQGNAFNESGDGNHDVNFNVTVNGETIASGGSLITLEPGTYVMHADLWIGMVWNDGVLERARGNLRVSLSPESLGVTEGVVYDIPLDADLADLGDDPTVVNVLATVNGTVPANNKVIVNSSSFIVE